LKGFLIQESETATVTDRTSAIYFRYVADAESVTVTKTNK